jgi:predicted glycosyltransferase
MSTVTSFPSLRPARKLLLYSHDTYGLGHIRRSLAIAQHLLAREESLQIVLISGSAVSDRFALPAGLSLVQLPPVVKIGPDSYQPHDSRLSLGLVRRARTAIIADVAGRLRPDVLLVDHSPAGMGGELLGVFAMLARDQIRTRVALGLRDVLDEPEAVTRVWARQGIYELLDRVYDELYVYGQQDIFDVGAAYGMRPELGERLRYCGYIDKPLAPASDPAPTRGPFLLATAGGGGDGAEVLSAALEAGGQIGLDTVVVTGPLMEPAQRAALDARAASTPGARVVSFQQGLGSLMRAASVIVTMGGYNSLCEAAATGTPTIVVPRTWPRREQAIRAQLFAQRGLVEVVAPGPGLGERLAGAVRGHLNGRRRRGVGIDLGGLDRLAEGLLGHGHVDLPVPAPAEIAA